jgi:hypothetical protein
MPGRSTRTLSIGMARRTKVSASTEAEVLVECRRRCCACFGLNRDEAEKRGQIAHLDGNPSNNAKENLAFLCFDHHDEYDSTTSQSKGLQRKEVETYRAELLYKFGTWSASLKRDELLNFLAFVTDITAMAEAALKIGKSLDCFGDDLVLRVLTNDEFDSNDALLWWPYVGALDHFASWGWLSFAQEERNIDGDLRVFFQVKRTPVCDEVAEKIREILRTRVSSEKPSPAPDA